MARTRTIIITPHGKVWVSGITYYKMPWTKAWIRLRWAWRNALPRVADALTGMVEMQKFIG